MSQRQLSEMELTQEQSREAKNDQMNVPIWQLSTADKGGRQQLPSEIEDIPGKYLSGDC